MTMPSSSSPTDPMTKANTNSAATLTITISDFAYQGPATVSPGAQITVTNKDSQKHTITADTKGGFTVSVAGRGGTATFTAPTTPGKYPYHCDFHAGMQATLVVK